MCLLILNEVYNRSGLSLIWISLVSSHISLSPLLIGLYSLDAVFPTSHMWKRTNFTTVFGGWKFQETSQCWPGLFDHALTSFLWEKLHFLKAALIGMIFKVIGTILLVWLQRWLQLLTAEITAAFNYVDWAIFGLTLTLLEGWILLLLNKLLGGHFGVALTIVDFLVRAVINCWFDRTILGKLIWYLYSLSLYWTIEA